MKSITSLQNQQNAHKKYRKNYPKDYTKRPWKTPSPALHNQLKSPRFTRNPNKDSSKDRQKQILKNDEHLNQYSINSKKKIGRPLASTNSRSQHYLAVKEAYSTHSNSNQNDDFKMRSHRYLQIKEPKQAKKPKLQTSGYNHYLLDRSPSHKEIFKTLDQLHNTQWGQSKQARQSSASEKSRNSKIYKSTILKKDEQYQNNQNASVLGGNNQQQYNQNHSHQSALQNTKQIEQHEQNLNYNHDNSVVSRKQHQQTIQRFNEDNKRLKRQMRKYYKLCTQFKKKNIELQRQCEKYTVEVTQLSVKIYQLKQQIYQFQINVDKHHNARNYSANSASNSASNNSSNILCDEQQISRLRSELLKNSSTHQQQVKRYKQLLQSSEQQLNNSNLQIYKMKQQLSQLHLCSNKFSHIADHAAQKQNESKNIKNAVIMDKKTKNRNLRNLSQSSDTKNSPTEDQQASHEHKYRKQNNYDHIVGDHDRQLSKQCLECKKLSTFLQQSTSCFQNQTFQVLQRDNIIAQMQIQIRNLQSQLRVLQKPKIIYKKYNTVLNELNQRMMSKQLGDLNKKYQNQDELDFKQSNRVYGVIRDVSPIVEHCIKHTSAGKSRKMKNHSKHHNG